MKRDHSQVSKDMQTVKFNVAGKIFEALREPTLSAFPKSRLCQLAEDPSVTQPIFVDANSELFQYILDFHRHRKVIIPISVSAAAVLREAKSLGLPMTLDQVTQDCPPMGKLAAMISDATKTEAEKAQVDQYMSRAELLAKVVISKAVNKIKANAADGVNLMVSVGELDDWVRGQLSYLARTKGCYGSLTDFNNQDLFKQMLGEWASSNGYTVEIEFSGLPSLGCGLYFDRATFKQSI